MLSYFLPGAITMGFFVSSLFFLRFWRSTGDGLFLGFAGAFLLLGVGQAMLSFSQVPVEERSPLYLVRLAAFVLILASIGWKNRQAARR
jgi:hypothetical protein